MPNLTVERIIQNFEVLGNWEDRYGYELRTAASANPEAFLSYYIIVAIEVSLR